MPSPQAINFYLLFKTNDCVASMAPLLKVIILTDAVYVAGVQTLTWLSHKNQSQIVMCWSQVRHWGVQNREQTHGARKKGA